MINVAVVGVGYWGPNLLRNFNEIKNSNVRLCCDLNTEKLREVEEKYPHIETTTDYGDVVGDEDIDAVVIATPPSTHYRLASQALKAGKHVFVEKPLTLNRKDAEKLIETASEKGRVLMVGHVFEYSPAVNKLKELIGDGSLGKIYYIYTSRLNLGLFQKDTDVFWDLATHDVSILFYLLGCMPDSVMAFGRSHILKNVNDVGFVNLMFPKGIFCNMHVSWLDPCKVRRIVVVGSKRMVVYDDTENLDKIRIYDKSVSLPSKYESFGEFQLSYNYGDVQTPKLVASEPLKLECQHFLECVSSGKKTQSSGKVGLKVVEIMEAIGESIKAGREVKLR